MSDIHCGKQTKLPKTTGSQFDTMSVVIGSQCPLPSYFAHLGTVSKKLSNDENRFASP